MEPRCNNVTGRSFSFEELRKMIQKSISDKIIVILDCCYSGSAKISKGHEEDAAKIGRTTIDEKSRFGQGKYILSASQAAQEAYDLTLKHLTLMTPESKCGLFSGFSFL